MSRSNPTSSTAHISTRWHEYNGASDGGTFRYFDKDATNEDGSKGANVDLGAKFRFLWLDETYCVTGFIEGHGGVFSNEIKNIREDVLTVKQFKQGGATVTGNWNKTTPEGETFIARVKAIGGKFTANIYIGYKEGDALRIGVLQLKGAAYAKWNEFFSKNKEAIQKGAVQVKAHEDGKKGGVKFKTPVFEVIDITEDTNKEAIELDRQLQVFLKEKLQHTPVAVTSTPPQPQDTSSQQQSPQQNTPPMPTEEDLGAMYGEDEDDSLPF